MALCSVLITQSRGLTKVSFPLWPQFWKTNCMGQYMLKDGCSQLEVDHEDEIPWRRL